MAGTIAYVITKRDYVDAGQITLLRRVRTPRFLMRLTIIAIVGALGGLWLSWWTMGPALGFAGIGAIYAVLLVLTILGGVYLLLPRRLGRLFDQQKSLDGDNGFAWNDDGATLTSPRGTTTYRWSDYHDWTMARALFLLYLNDQAYHLAPCRAMTADQRIDLHETLSRGFGKTTDA